MRILNIGSMNIDYVYKVEHIVSEGETQNVLLVETNVGGKGLNQSVAATRAGGTVFHAGMIGKEGKILVDFLKKSEVDISLVSLCEKDQGHAVIQVDKQGRNSILVYGGSNKMITKEYIDKVLEEFSSEDILMVNNEVSEAEYMLKKAHEKKMKTVFNASPIDNILFNMDLNNVTYLVVNESEGEALSGEKEPKMMLESILHKYHDIRIILTLGPDGSMYRDKEKTIYQESYKVEVKDTTAAGDTFMGYFTAGIAKGLKAEDCMKMASMAAAIAVTKHGAAETIPYITLVNKELNQ
ncbi:MAG: ribokinase [Clostridiaceae bacterium]|jgi:ribokinase|nr:ribokinase [Clostridiaceae bacterium]